MRVSIYQPRYFPQLHYFNRMLDSDTFVFLDTAQYTKSLRQKIGSIEKRHPSFQSDTSIKLPHGEYLLTVPIRHDGYSPLNKTYIDYSQRWDVKHLSVIKSAYKNSPYFIPVYESLKNILTNHYNTLAELNITTTVWPLLYLLHSNLDPTIDAIGSILEKQIKIRLKKVILGSKLGVERPPGHQKGTEWTTAICLELGADEYLHGRTAQENYMNHEYYLSHGIIPIVQNWVCQKYPQQFEKKVGFIENLSIMDLLFNTNPKEALQILLSQRDVYAHV